MSIIQITDRAVHSDEVYFMLSDKQPCIAIVYVNSEEVVRFVPTILPKEEKKIVDVVFNLMETYEYPLEDYPILKQLYKERKGGNVYV